MLQIGTLTKTILQLLMIIAAMPLLMKYLKLMFGMSSLSNREINWLLLKMIVMSLLMIIVSYS